MKRILVIGFIIFGLSCLTQWNPYIYCKIKLKIILPGENGNPQSAPVLPWYPSPSQSSTYPSHLLLLGTYLCLSRLGSLSLWFNIMSPCTSTWHWSPIIDNYLMSLPHCAKYSVKQHIYLTHANSPKPQETRVMIFMLQMGELSPERLSGLNL